MAIKVFPDRGPLRNFASCFHQDWKLLDSDFETTSRNFIDGLSALEKAEFRKKLGELLQEYPGASGKGLRNAFVRAGADSAPLARELKAELQELLQRLAAA